jgi:hypothetical protein
MGNINYKNIICDNYYCHSVSFKPEWFSESSWNINYEYNKVDRKKNIQSDCTENVIQIDNEKNLRKPYLIDKGILKINYVNSFDLLLSKKILIGFYEIKCISIPINFKYNIDNDNEFNIYIIFSSKLLLLNSIDILNNNDDYFYINLKLSKYNCLILRSFNNDITKKKINSKKINTFSINLEDNLKIISLTEKLYNNNQNNIYENKYFKSFNFDIQNNFFLNILIKTKENLLFNEFVELNFE